MKFRDGEFIQIRGGAVVKHIAWDCMSEFSSSVYVRQMDAYALFLERSELQDGKAQGRLRFGAGNEIMCRRIVKVVVRRLSVVQNH